MSSAFRRAAASSPSPSAHATKNARNSARRTPQRVQIAAGHADTEVLAVGDQGAQPVEVGQAVTVLARPGGRIHESNREFRVGVEIHSRS